MPELLFHVFRPFFSRGGAPGPAYASQLPENEEKALVSATGCHALSRLGPLALRPRLWTGVPVRRDLPNGYSIPATL
jgi:hypothetical protein